ncbi:MAG: CsbD family protein [Candidatus Contendobacter sp.]|nr:CsbD family protein [Candidatus Contendobacter sp.]
MNKQQVKGRCKEAKGKVNEVAGYVVGNDELEAEGKLQKNAGKVQAGVGDAKAEIKKDH